MKRSVLLAGLACLALPGGAQAAFTSSNVTSPSGFHLHDSDANGGTGTNVNLTATVQGAAVGEEALIRCYTAGGHDTVASDVPIVGGAINATIKLDSYNSPCRLAAVPEGDAAPTTKEELAAFTGPEVTVARLDRYHWSGNSGPVYNFNLTIPTAGGYVDVQAPGGAGLQAGGLRTPGGELVDYYSWYYTLSLDTSPGSGRRGLIVDGRTAYASSDARGAYANAATKPQPTWTFQRDASGAATVVVEEPLSRCALTDSLNPTPAECGDFVATGVKLVRRYSTSADSRRVDIEDRFVSTDGAAHAVRVDFHLAGGYNNGAPAFALPGTAGLVGYGGGDEVPVPAASVAAMRWTGDTLYPEGNPYNMAAGLVYHQRPNGGPFTFTSDSEFLMPHDIAVPAGGDARLAYTAFQGRRQSEVIPALEAEVARLTPAPPAPPANPPAAPPATPATSGTPKPGTTASGCKVPRVTGLTETRAKARLKSAGCKLGRVRRSYTAKRKSRGKVLRQSRRAGLQVSANAKVDLTVGSARRPKARRR